MPLERACQLKEHGGLGIKNLSVQNKCLLLKLLHRLHRPGDSAWARWVRGRIDMVSMAGDIMGPHWRDLEELLLLYRAVTLVKSAMAKTPASGMTAGVLLQEVVQERIQCRANLLKKNAVDDASCELCRQSNEDCNHIIFTCPFAVQVWAHLGVDTTGGSVASLWTVPRPATVPPKHYDSFLLLTCWHIWKHRNEIVFNGAPPSLRRLLTACSQDAMLWSCRWPQSERMIADAWCRVFSQM